MRLTVEAERRLMLLSKALEAMAHESADGADIRALHFQQLIAEVEGLVLELKEGIRI